MSETEKGRAMSAAELEGKTWALRPEVLQGFLRDRSSLNVFLDSSSDHLIEEQSPEKVAAARMRAQGQVASGVAVIPLKGVLMPQMSLLAMLFGLGSGLGEFRSALNAAVGNSDIGTIVLDVDSPGGLVDLIPEVAQEVRQARDNKTVIAVVNTLSASAAYWISAQASEIVITPSGEAGSIGVYTEHRDISGALEAAGVKPTLISAGKFKVETNPYEPLSDSAEAALQQGVDDFYDLFTKDVAAGRGVKQSEVRSGYGQGRTLTAERAVEANLADRVGTLDEVVSGLISSSSAPVQGVQGHFGAVTYTKEDLERVFDQIGAVGEAARKEAVH